MSELATDKFRRGDRVRRVPSTDPPRRTLLGTRDLRYGLRSSEFGTVTGFGRDGRTVRVWVDGTKKSSISSWGPGWWEKI